jgi:predicted PurR-regulated permease PerM
VAASRKPIAMNHPVIVTFLIFAIIGFMYLAGAVLKPLAFSVLLAFALVPISEFFERRGLPRAIASILTVLIALGTIGGIGYKVFQQLDSLAYHLPEYEDILLPKLQKFRFNQGGGTVERVERFQKDVTSTLVASSKAATKSGDGSAPATTKKDEAATPANPEPAKPVEVRVVDEKQNLIKEVAETAGPYLELVGIFAFDLILVLFILTTRDDLSDRLIRLFGRGKISLTTKTLDEVGHRISRYITTFAMVNSTMGLVVGLGLWAIGLPYPLVWGVLAAMLRFVPYAGPATAFLLPFAFSFIHFPTMTGSLQVLALFATLEIAANSFLEPMIYGKTTGVSALGLLVAAMFWAWLWGPLGLLLSTPLTVCLAVLGKYVPALKVFATFLGEEATLKPDVRFYQRLLARDQDGAVSHAEELLKEMPRAALFDQIFIPTLSMAERDYLHEDIDDDRRDFAWWVVDEVVQDIESTPRREIDLAPAVPEAHAQARVPTTPTEPARIAGIPSNDRGDLLALRMLQVLLAPSGCRMELLDVGSTPLQVTERLADDPPTMIIVSHLPPDGLTATRYLVRRLHARFKDIPILVGRWAETTETAADRITDAGATQVVSSLADARDSILKRLGLTTAPESPAPKTAEPAAV